MTLSRIFFRIDPSYLPTTCVLLSDPLTIELGSTSSTSLPGVVDWDSFLYCGFLRYCRYCYHS
jgi:hypothetical protein